MSTHFRTRLATPEDGQGIFKLAQKVSGVKYQISHWRWEFLNNPTHKFCTFIAEDNGNIIGQQSLLPVWMNLDGGKILGAQSVNTMTHPAYRGQGINTSLARECYTYAASQGVELLYRFPNEQSYPIALRLGWTDLGTLPCLMKILKPKTFIRSFLRRIPRSLKSFNPKSIIQGETIPKIVATIAKNPGWFLLKSGMGKQRGKAVGYVKVERIDTFDSRFDDFWSKVKGMFPISIWRDSAYLNWRYRSHPDENYTVLIAEEDVLTGFIVVKCSRGQYNTGYIVDFLSLPDKAGSALHLISAALGYLKNQGMDRVMCHVLEHSPLYQLLKDRGFFRYGEGLRFMVRPNTPDFPSGTVLDRNQWYLMEGDIDTF